MNLSNLQPAEVQRTIKIKDKGGEGSEKVVISSRDTKEQKSRSGYSKKIGFEGGQMPFQRRVPKFDFLQKHQSEDTRCKS
jgi:large subunit ribosomal protein L15